MSLDFPPVPQLMTPKLTDVAFINENLLWYKRKKIISQTKKMTSYVSVSKFTIKRNALQMLGQNLNWGLAQLLRVFNVA